MRSALGSARPPRLLLTGFCSRGNLGDDFMLRQAARCCESIGIDSQVLPLPRSAVELVRFVGAARRAGRVVLVGGSHFDVADGDRAYSRSVLRHTALALIVRLCRRPYDAAGIGLTSPSKRSQRLLVRVFIASVTRLTVRDSSSARVVMSLGHRAPDLYPDPCLATAVPGPRPPSGAVLLVAPAARHRGSDVTAASVVALGQRLGSTRVRLLAAFAPPDADGDRPTVVRLLEELMLSDVTNIEYVEYAGDPLDPQIWSSVGAVLSERYHVSVIGAVLGCQVEAIRNTEKQRLLDVGAFAPTNLPASRARWEKWLSEAFLP